jgi:anti-sigma factor RsiW
MTGPHVHEELGGYLLGALEPAEREAVARHLETCPECAAEHAHLAGLPALLQHADGLDIPPPPPAVEERLLDQVAHEAGLRRHGRRTGLLGRLVPPPRWRRRLGRGRLAATAVAGAALGAAVTAFALGGDDDSASLAQYRLQLTGASGASARAELEPGRGGTEVHLWVKGLPPGVEAVYEVHCERRGWSASAGSFRADAHGRAYVVLTTAARVGEYDRIRVVRRSEPRDADVMSGEVQ